MAEPVVRVRAVVHGRVQMVGFRAFVITHADDAGLSGTVRNQPDGTVEAVLEGPGPDVDRMLGLLRQGPSHARVERVDVEYSAPTGKLPAMMVAS
jgi:acylphosphatase